MATELDCIFCAIVSGRAPASSVYQDESVVAFMDIRPVVRGHTLVVAREHCPLVTELDPATWQRMCHVGRLVDAALRRTAGVSCDAIALFVADGAEAGQEIPHAHLHVIPRRADDGFGFRFPPGYGRLENRRDLDLLASSLRSGLGEHAVGE